MSVSAERRRPVQPSPAPTPAATAANENAALPPAAVLACGKVLEIAPAAHGDGPAALGFALALLAGRIAAGGAVLIGQTGAAAREFGRPYAPGLAGFGLAPERLVYAETRHEQGVLRLGEEAVYAGALAGVLLRLPPRERRYGFTESRRLVLRAEASGTPVLVLRSRHAEGSTAAAARWRLAAAPSAEAGYFAPAGTAPGIGITRWQAVCERARAGRPGSWKMEWDHAAHRLCVADADGERSCAAASTAR